MTSSTYWFLIRSFIARLDTEQTSGEIRSLFLFQWDQNGSNVVECKHARLKWGIFALCLTNPAICIMSLFQPGPIHTHSKSKGNRRCQKRMLNAYPKAGFFIAFITRYSTGIIALCMNVLCVIDYRIWRVPHVLQAIKDRTSSKLHVESGKHVASNFNVKSCGIIQGQSSKLIQFIEVVISPLMKILSSNRMKH